MWIAKTHNCAQQVKKLYIEPESSLGRRKKTFDVTNIFSSVFTCGSCAQRFTAVTNFSRREKLRFYRENLKKKYFSKKFLPCRWWKLKKASLGEAMKNFSLDFTTMVVKVLLKAVTYKIENNFHTKVSITFVQSFHIHLINQIYWHLIQKQAYIQAFIHSLDYFSTVNFKSYPESSVHLIKASYRFWCIDENF